MTTSADRKLLGAYYTPDDLVTTVVDAVVTDDFVQRRRGRPIRVLDPACGDGRFLRAVEAGVRRRGGVVALHGVDLDPSAVAQCRARMPGAAIDLDDALSRRWPADRYDLVIGNPPFLSQMAQRTTRGGKSRHGGGPYADAAVEFLALGADLVDPDGGRLALVLPQSVLSSRDAGPVRDRIDQRATMVWSWWAPERVFDAQVHTCVVAFEFSSSRAGTGSRWTEVVTQRQGIPTLPAMLRSDGVLGDRATLNANFRDEYYGLVPAVGDHPAGPPLITSGLIDPGRSSWGQVPITFARRRFARPRVALDLLDARMTEWARRRLVPKVLVANQTRIIEAVCDPGGAWLPGVPVVAVYPHGTHWDDDAPVRTSEATAAAWQIAAVLTSGGASVWLWHRTAGTGLTATSMRVSPVVLADLPWPLGDLTPAVEALRSGDVRTCARLVDAAYGVEVTDGGSVVAAWWEASLDRIEARQATRPA
ncbi:MAG TPA: N-6 DNA methylase [Ilumatobacteraceae bacterium]|nr:N-6 DNA methylase [Ilumatobacteraceae bacterium]